jgi:hypothetical protein
MLVMDRLVAGLPLELREIVVAQGHHRGRVCEADQTFVVDHPHRLRDAVEDRLEKRLRLDVPVRELGRS